MKFRRIDKYKILRNSLSDNIRYTYNIIYGDHDISGMLDGARPAETYYGVADVTVFPLIAKMLVEYAVPKRNSDIKDTFISSLAKSLSLFIGILLQKPRLIIVNVLTLLVLPLVAIFHILKYPYVQRLKSECYQLQGVNSSKPNEDITLGDYVNQTHTSLGELSYSKNNKIISNSRSNIGFVANAGNYCIDDFAVSLDLSTARSVKAARKLGFFIAPCKEEVNNEVMAAIPDAPADVASLITSLI